MNLDIVLSKILGKPIHLYGVYHVGGGAISQTYKVLTDVGAFFVKVKSSQTLPKLYEKECSGLKTLKETNTLTVANPIGSWQHEQYQYLVLEWIEEGPKLQNYWEELGHGLAKLHLNKSKYFGFSEDNYIGSLAQLNSKSSNWSEFYIEQRLEPMVKKASDSGYLDSTMAKKLVQYYKLVESVFPDESPALLHGDFWKGNILVNEIGKPVLIDPAVYFGHREMDIAMTKFVGSFPKEFYGAYLETYPLVEDWEYRMDFCLIYYQLVHLNLFGDSYLHQLSANLDRWLDF
ncbi:MAG: fructosamine kinase family protein [Bacteroidia bacterium]